MSKKLKICELIRGLRLREVIATAFVLFSASSFANVGDEIIRFSSSGVDRYADGTVVPDGECYALVWSPAGRAFSGFNADGTAYSPNDRVILAAPLAKGGKCLDAIFQIPSAEYAALKNGHWSVCLVDTRNSRGVPTGVDAEGVPNRVNRWGIVGYDVSLDSSAGAAAVASSGGPTVMSMLGVPTPRGARASNLSAVPGSTPKPRITAMEVGDGVVALAVEGTVPYLTYDIEAGDTPTDFYPEWAVDPVDGAADGKVVIKAWKSTSGSQFFRVRRAEQ